jgi:predicted permease
MIKSFRRLYDVNPGFEPRNVLKMQVALPDWKYAEPEQLIAFWRTALARIDTLPGVVAAGITSSLPVNEFSTSTLFVIENRTPTVQGEVLMSHFRRVTPGFFQAMGIPLVSGRLFTKSDDEKGLPVAVISQEMANVFWPNEDPIGKRLQRQRKVPDNPWFTVVGVVGDVQDAGLGSAPEPTFYIPYPQNTIPDMNLVVRTAVDPLSAVKSIRRTIQEVDREQPIAEVETMEEWISGSLNRRRFSTFLLSFFAALGLTLALVGIYGVLSYSVSQRRQEMGIRMALGADGANLRRLVLRHSLVLTLIGLGLGTAVALLLTRLISGLLYGVEATDPGTFLGIAVGLLLVAALASYLPARRASRVDPIVSLKYQ